MLILTRHTRGQKRENGDYITYTVGYVSIVLLTVHVKRRLNLGQAHGLASLLEKLRQIKDRTTQSIDRNKSKAQVRDVSMKRIKADQAHVQRKMQIETKA